MHNARYFRTLTETRLQLVADAATREAKRLEIEKQRLSTFDQFRATIKSVMVTAAASRSKFIFVRAPELFLLDMLKDSGFDFETIDAFNTNDELSVQYLIEDQADQQIPVELEEVLQAKENHICFRFFDIFEKPILHFSGFESFAEFSERYIENWWLDGVCLACLADDFPSFFSLVTLAAEAGRNSYDFTLHSSIQNRRLRLEYNSKPVYSNLDAISEAFDCLGFRVERRGDLLLRLEW
jgi:hypothetical protein